VSKKKKKAKKALKRELRIKKWLANYVPPDDFGLEPPNAAKEERLMQAFMNTEPVRNPIWMYYD